MSLFHVPVLSFAVLPCPVILFFVPDVNMVVSERLVVRHLGFIFAVSVSTVPEFFPWSRREKGSPVGQAVFFSLTPHGTLISCA